MILFPSPRQPKPKNRPSFRQILMHLDIAAGAFLAIPPETYLTAQVFFHFSPPTPSTSPFLSSSVSLNQYVCKPIMATIDLALFQPK